MKYIDADLLREKIVREVEQWKEKTANHYTIEAEARWSEANYILNILDSLQQEQPEVDLEKVTNYSRINELPEGFNKEWLKYYHTDNEYNSAKFHHTPMVEREYIIARHFYELGLNARKEEEQ